MITGVHAIQFTPDADALRAFLADTLELPSVDAGRGWLIFGLPGGEVALHPGEENDQHELYLMCDDLPALMTTLGERGVACGPVHEQPWGDLTQVTLPGGGKLGIYQPKHPVAVGLAAKH